MDWVSIGSVKLSDRLRETRARKSWTQQQAAEYFGVSVAAYQNWEKGSKPPSKDRLPVLADWIGVSPEELGPLRPKPLAALAADEVYALRQQLLDSRSSEIANLRREIEDIRASAVSARSDFEALRKFIEPRLDFLDAKHDSPLMESLELNYRLLSDAVEKQLVALSRRVQGIASLHHRNAAESFDSRADRRQ